MTHKNRQLLRLIISLAFVLLILVLAFGSDASNAVVRAEDGGTIPPNKPELMNAGMECASGYTPALNSFGDSIFAPTGWTIALESGAPHIHSGRIYFEQRADSTGGCFTERTHVERIEGRDSVVVQARDLETNPEPGKPFDVILSQRIPAMAGGDYSLSSWMLSLCGGSAVPSDCPDDVYIVKALGIDPTGGDNPLGDTVEWVEDRRNFVDENDERIGWTNLRMGSQAKSDHITIYTRLESPFQHHGNHGFIDAVSIVRAPKAWFEAVPNLVKNRRSLYLTWDSDRSADIDAISGGTYEYMVDIQAREKGQQEWHDVAVGLPDDSPGVLFCAPELEAKFEFRIRARAEQPPAPPEGAWPNHRYPGAWSDPMLVRFVTTAAKNQAPDGDFRIYVPVAGYSEACDLLP